MQHPRYTDIPQLPEVYTLVQSTSSSWAKIDNSGLSISLTGSWTSPPIIAMEPESYLFLGSSSLNTTPGKWISRFWYSEGNASTSPTVSSLVLDDLYGIKGAFFVRNVSNIKILSAPTLVYIGQDNNATVTHCFSPQVLPALTDLNFLALKYLSNSFLSSQTPALTNMNFPNLEYIGGGFSPSQAAALTNMNLPSLKDVVGNFNPNNMASLTSISISAIKNIAGTFNPATMISLSSINFPPLGNWKFLGGNITISNIPLNTSTVNNLMSALAYMDGNNETILYGSGKSVAVTGGSGPTHISTVTTPGSQFVCSGTTCTVNWIGHGYSTGDVLRISDITVATNANRYAVINVVNADQFTYTITSQTATGAGTATVSLANNDVKAIVTRGVTLTTA